MEGGSEGKQGEGDNGGESMDAKSSDETKDDQDGIEGLNDAILKERAAAKAAGDALKDVQKNLVELEKEKTEHEAVESEAKCEELSASIYMD